MSGGREERRGQTKKESIPLFLFRCSFFFFAFCLCFFCFYCQTDPLQRPAKISLSFFHSPAPLSLSFSISSRLLVELWPRVAPMDQRALGPRLAGPTLHHPSGPHLHPSTQRHVIAIVSSIRPDSGRSLHSVHERILPNQDSSLPS